VVFFLGGGGILLGVCPTARDALALALRWHAQESAQNRAMQTEFRSAENKRVTVK
jgi:hypothetical protein